MAKAQRIRDPLHNLIEFDEGEFEQTLWKVLNTRPMQRLRRIKQLGFGVPANAVVRARLSDRVRSE